MRIEATIGSDPSARLSLYRPLFGTRLFTRSYAAAEKNTLDTIQDDVVVAAYKRRRLFAGADLGVNLSRVAEITGGFRFGRLDADVETGDPGLPELNGLETDLRIEFRHDGHDSPVVPSRGTRARISLTRYLASPDNDQISRTNEDATQLEASTATFWKWRTRNRLFVVASGGTSFNAEPISQFELGYPFRLDAFSVGERRGDHYGVLTVGCLRQLGRLPDFLGGPVFVGSWIENGSAFNSDADANFNTHAAVGVVVDSLIGPLVGATSFGLDGGWRAFIAIGRMFR
jgi:hypothetical protein